MDDKDGGGDGSGDGVVGRGGGIGAGGNNRRKRRPCRRRDDGGQIDTLRKSYADQVEILQDRVDKLAYCLSVGKYYQPGQLGADANGCGKNLGS